MKSLIKIPQWPFRHFTGSGRGNNFETKGTVEIFGQQGKYLVARAAIAY